MPRVAAARGKMWSVRVLGWLGESWRVLALEFVVGRYFDLKTQEVFPSYHNTSRTPPEPVLIGGEFKIIQGALEPLCKLCAD